MRALLLVFILASGAAAAPFKEAIAYDWNELHFLALLAMLMPSSFFSSTASKVAAFPGQVMDAKLGAAGRVADTIVASKKAVV